MVPCRQSCTTHIEEAKAVAARYAERSKERPAQRAEREKAQRRDILLSAIQESPSRISKIRRNPAECVVCEKAAPAGLTSLDVVLSGSKTVKASRFWRAVPRTVKVCEECAGVRVGR